MTTYWPEEIPRTLEYPDVSVGELLVAACRRGGDRVAVQDGELRFTYTELWEEASAAARALRADGVGPGDAVLLHVPNSAWFVVSYLAVQLVGAVASPASPLHPVAGLRTQLLDVETAVAIGHPAHVDTLVKASADSTVRRVVLVPGSAAAPAPADVVVPDRVTPYAAWALDRSGPLEAVPVAADSLAHLIFTGGTTGAAKGVRTLQSNVVSQVTQALIWRGGILISVNDGELEFTQFRDDGAIVVDDTVSLIVGPLYHTQSLLTLCNVLCVGGRVLVPGRFDPAMFLRLIEEERVTYINGSPSMWQAVLGCADLASRDLSSVRAVSSGAAPLDGRTDRAMSEAFPNAMIIEGYGLTEGTCLVISVPGFRGARRKLGSVGQPIVGTDMEIRDGAGRVLGAGAAGELWLRGPEIVDGYHRASEKTAEQFIDGWLRTGDVAYVDDEGFVFISGRSKDMLVYKGYNVYPRVLEDTLTTHPEVALAAVVGRDDSEVGQIPVAFIVPSPGTTPDPTKVLEYVAERVLPYQRVREVIVVGELPRNAAGKILKTELRDRL